MKKTILLLFAAAFATSVAAQPDTLSVNKTYYPQKRNVEELVPVTPRNIVMLGNSLTERGYWSEYFQKERVLNRGIGGDCISGMIHRIDPIVEGQPRAIFIMGGANDLIFSKISDAKLLEQYERLLDIIARKVPHEGLRPEPAAAQRVDERKAVRRQERPHRLVQQVPA